MRNAEEIKIAGLDFLCEQRSVLCQIVQNEFPMDALTEVLNSLRVRSTVYCPIEIGAPWGLHIAEEMGAPFFILTRGEAFLVIEELNIRQWLKAGDFIVMTKRCACQVSDSPESEIADLQEWLRRNPPKADGTFKVQGNGAVPGHPAASRRFTGRSVAVVAHLGIPYPSKFAAPTRRPADPPGGAPLPPRCAGVVRASSCVRGTDRRARRRSSRGRWCRLG